jgi:flagellin-like protein
MKTGKKSRKGMSAVVATVIIVAITITIGALVWSVVSNLIGGEVKKSESCFGVLDQVHLNNDYTCYDSINKRMQFSISVGDLDADSIVVAVAFEGNSKSATLTNQTQALADVTNYPDGDSGVKMPGKNAGSTYFFDDVASLPSSVSIVPVINGEQCGSADTLYEIDDCRSLLS